VRLLTTPFFTELDSKGLLGSSLSSGAARGRLRICQEAPKDGIGDAPLETPQRLLTGFALRDLLAVVGSTPSVRPGLAYRNHVQEGVVEMTVSGQREPVTNHLATGDLYRRRAAAVGGGGGGGGGEVVALVVGKRAALPTPSR
jgi:hypothetical protein